MTRKTYRDWTPQEYAALTAAWEAAGDTTSIRGVAGRIDQHIATTTGLVRRLRQAYQRAQDAATLIRDRLTCRRRGHLWDTDRPAGPIHERDICWRCDAVREEKR